MKETTVYTSDTKNNKVYSTTDKLYLAHASSPRATTIFVGANSAGNLDSGLGVNSKYWAGDFWLRTPYKATVYHYVMVTSNTNSFVHYTTPYETVKLDLRPAFELDASTILFASAALAATSDGALTLQDTDGNGAFTLRYLASDLGSASVSYDKSQVMLQNVPENTYLVAQNRTNAYARKITAGTTSVSASEMGFEDFSNCKVWLETTDTAQRMTYATLAAEEPGYSVKITAGIGMTIISDNGTQYVRPGDSISEITVEVADGYDLPQGYLDAVTGLNGLTINSTAEGFAISGTPTKDVSITLKDAEIHKEDSSVSITTPSLDKDYDGIPVVEPAVVKTGSTKDVVFTWYQEDGSGWQTLASAPSDAGSYKVVASVEADENYNGASDELEFSIRKAANEWTEELSITGWTYGDPANTPTAAAKYGTVTFAYSDSGDGVYTDTVPTNAGTWYVRATVAAGENYGALEAVKEFQIAKAGSTVAITTSSLDKKYDGIAVGNPAVEKTGSTKDVVFTWYQEDGSGWKELVSAPADPGSYRVVASVEGDANYNGATSAGLAFFISRTANEWTQALSITGWTYGDPANAPTAAAKYGTVAFAYSNSETGPYTAAVPTNAGTWYVRATVAADVNYTGLETTKAFEIKKAIPAFVIPQNLTMKQGEALSTVSLPNGFAWKNAAQTADAFGTKQFKAIYTPADTENYQAVEVNIAVEVQKTQDTPADDARPPQTGDNSNIPLWVALLLLSGGVLGAVTYRKKKQSN